MESKKHELLNGAISIDDRGSLRFINEFSFEGVKRFYHVENHRSGFIRAWHGHRKEGKYVYVVSGSALVGIVDMKTEEITKVVLSAQAPKILWIPPNNYNGFKSLEQDTKIIFFSTTTLQESMGDDIRQPYDKWNIWEDDFR